MPRLVGHSLPSAARGRRQRGGMPAARHGSWPAAQAKGGGIGGFGGGGGGGGGIGGEGGEGGGGGGEGGEGIAGGFGAYDMIW